MLVGSRHNFNANQRRGVSSRLIVEAFEDETEGGYHVEDETEGGYHNDCRCAGRYEALSMRLR